MTSKKNSEHKTKVKEKLKKKTIQATSRPINSEERNLNQEVTMKMKNHWGVIQKDFKILADDMATGFKDVKEILSEKGMDSIKDIQNKMNTRFAWK